MGNEKASIEKGNRTLQATLSDVQRKCDEANLILGDYDNAKKKVVIENADLLRQIEELDNNNMTLQKIRDELYKNRSSRKIDSRRLFSRE